MLGDEGRVILTDGESTSGKQAAEALVKIGESALESLVAALKSENKRARKTAAWALARLKHPGSVEGLIGALKDEEPGVRRWAAWALWKITRKNFGYDTEEWRKWWEENKIDYLGQQ